MKLSIQDNILYLQSEQHTSLEQLFTTFHIPRKQRYFLYQKESITINDEIIKKDTEIECNDTLVLTLPFVEDTIAPLDEPIDIVYEDDLFLMVNKPVYLLVHSDGVKDHPTLNNYVKAYYMRKAIQAPIRPIHRLDYETSGIVIYCKIPFFQPLLDHMMETKQIQRIYLALLKGNMKEKEVIIRKGIARDRHNAQKMRISKDGSSAWTKVIRKKELDHCTLCECHLKSGRTHQIRIHTSSIGYPILSDSLYGSKDPRISRCALHSWVVKLYHPLLQKQIEVECELPKDMLSVVKGDKRIAK